MRAVVMDRTGGPEVLRISEVPIPTISPTQVLIQVAATGICGHDQADRSGLTTVALPVVLGHEIAGVVEAVGSDVAGFAVGDRVAAKQFATCGQCRDCTSGDELRCSHRQFVYGGWAEFAVVEHTALLPVPAEVDLVQAAVVACTVGTCLQALERVAGLQSGEYAVVTGAGGGLGIHGLQVAKALDAYTIATTTSPEKVPALLASGADDVVITGGGDEVERLWEATNGVGIHVVLDNVGHPALFRPLFRTLADGGRYVFTGQVARHKIELYPAFLFTRQCTITGSASTLRSTFHRSLELVASGIVRPVVETYLLDSIVEVNELLDDSRITGRAVVTP
jgi:acryloyl-coenzyme A reductase